MKFVYLLSILFFVGCNNNSNLGNEPKSNVDFNLIIGTPKKIGSILVAQNDFPILFDSWDIANKVSSHLGKGWRMPTKSELKILYENQIEIKNFKYKYYWSSSEGEFWDNDAWYQNFKNGEQGTMYKGSIGAVRAVKSIN